MKTVTTTTYVCEVCGQGYDTPAEAIVCEARPVTHDRGVKVGDTVIVSAGDGTDCKALVTSLGVTKTGWGPKVFNHSVVLCGDILEVRDKGFSRVLHFDSYKKAAEA